MTAATSLDMAFANHRYTTERALAELRADTALDDLERSRRITRVIEKANAQAVELMRRKRGPAASLLDRPPEAEDREGRWPEAAPDLQTSGTLLQYRQRGPRI